MVDRQNVPVSNANDEASPTSPHPNNIQLCCTCLPDSGVSVAVGSSITDGCPAFSRKRWSHCPTASRIEPEDWSREIPFLQAFATQIRHLYSALSALGSGWVSQSSHRPSGHGDDLRRTDQDNSAVVGAAMGKEHVFNGLTDDLRNHQYFSGTKRF